MSDSKSGGGTWGTLIIVAVGYFMYSFGWAAVHSRVRYAVQYGVDARDVIKDDRPHDCQFLTAPLGFKGCEYIPVVSVTKTNPDGRWDLDCDTKPVADQPTCLQFRRWTPGPQKTAVYVAWEKQAD